MWQGSIRQVEEGNGPITISFRLINIIGVNTFILHQAFKNNPNLEKADFITITCWWSYEAPIWKKSKNANIRHELRFSIRRIQNVLEELEIYLWIWWNEKNLLLISFKNSIKDIQIMFYVQDWMFFEVMLKLGLEMFDFLSACSFF